jgi:hypothetical protein
MGTISIRLRQLPTSIRYVGYVFQLEYRQFNQIWWIGYFVSRCESKKKDKKAAFTLGFWTDKDPKTHTSSVETPLLTGIPLWDDDDQELYHSLRALERNLVQNFGYTPPISAIDTAQDTEYEEIRPLSIPQKISI